jgi:integration host factor subunit beta
MAAKTIALNTLSKRALAEAVAEKTGQNQSMVLQSLQSFLDEMVEQLAIGNRLEFREFGVFETVMRKPRMALNPKTLEAVPVQEKAVVKFKPGRLMKQRVQEYGFSAAKPDSESPS